MVAAFRHYNQLTDHPHDRTPIHFPQDGGWTLSPLKTSINTGYKLRPDIPTADAELQIETGSPDRSEVSTAIWFTGWAVAQTCCISQCAKYRKSGKFGYPWEQNP